MFFSRAKNFRHAGRYFSLAWFLIVAIFRPMDGAKFGRWLIVANGEAKVSNVGDLSRWMVDRQTVILDGAALAWEKNSLRPNMLMGDFDSIDPRLLERWGSSGVTILHCQDQNYTDLEKAIQFTISHGAVDILILNALGGRMDHTLANIFFLKKYIRRGRRLVICDGVQYIECFHNETRELIAPASSYCGFFGMPRATISSNGLKYEMRNFLVRIGKQESVANEFRFETAKIAVRGTCLAVYAVA
ncbi:MAG: thiamine diphosphokinase [Puniceicoccales bacterium]|jgi:thiamine pyrophosphokinase|nr:thiamine diphosphokinase [Puniceicoccales bacterium]